MARPRPAVAAATILLHIFFFFFFFMASSAAASDDDDRGAPSSFVGVDGTQFVTSAGGGNGNSSSTVYFSGFNAYWLMLLASDPAQRPQVVAAFRQAREHGLNLARTWAFSDGGQTPLQSSPGVYNEAMFQGLDFVIAEARRHGVYLLLCLTNNFHDFGGKRQYVAWAREAGNHNLTTDDDFFNSTVVKGYYKDHVKAVLTRVNTLTGVAYRDDPTILAWELMNEPRCDADPTGAMVQAWVEEMAPYVKSIDGNNHLVTAGLEGFYGDGAHESKDLNPWGIYYGTNFIATHLAAGVDFATIHLYPDVWLWGSGPAKQLAFLRNWTSSHAMATELYLAKPLLVTEYGKFLWDGVSNQTQRDYFLELVLDSIYDSAAEGGPLVGGAFWQLLDPGMDALRDGYEIILADDRRAASIIGNHSRQLAELNGQDVEEVRRRRRRRRQWPGGAHRKVHVGSSSGGSSSSGDQTSQLHHGLLARHFISLFRSISSLFVSSSV